MTGFLSNYQWTLQAALSVSGIKNSPERLFLTCHVLSFTPLQLFPSLILLLVCLFLAACLLPPSFRAAQRLIPGWLWREVHY